MKNLGFYIKVILMIGVTFSVLFWGGNIFAFNIACLICLIFFLINNSLLPITRKEKILYSIIYNLILIGQILINTLIIDYSLIDEKMIWIYRFIGVVLILIPFFIRQIIYRTGLDFYVYPIFNRCYNFTYTQLIKEKEMITSKIETLSRAKSKINRKQLKYIIKDLPRHSVFSYVNNGSLSDEYFEKANSTLNNGYIYLVISKTKSPASEIIGAFTNKMYNHISISFDENLSTIVSYNGGGNIYSPGLNEEILEELIKNDGASIMVYRLEATEEEKQIIIDEIKEITKVGSAYNISGLLFQYTAKPNIMFCSQFVYKMLQLADLNYFNKKVTRVKPTDFVELDYYRKLEFVEKLEFNEDIVGEIESEKE